MGVTGLWRLIEPSGQPVPLQTLDNKVLAVDVSIWLHQAIKGFQSAHGGTIPNAHLLGIYHRICKLLFYGIKPVVIFDGGVPYLKRQIIIQRANKRTKALNEADLIHKQLVSALLKHTAISKILSDESKVKLAIKPLKEKAEDIYKLPPPELSSTQSEDESSTSIDSSPTKHWDLHTIDEKSTHFKALPADVRHDILTDLKETRKQSSWGKIHEMPKKSDDFSGFQMKRLLKRYSVQVSLEEAEKEMGGRSLSLAELEALLNDQGVVTCDSVGKRIASDENKRYLLIKDLKKAMNEAKHENEVMTISEESLPESGTDETVKDNFEMDNEIIEVKNGADEEFEEDLKMAIELSLQEVPSSSHASKPTSNKKHNFSFLQDFSDADFPTSSGSEDDYAKPSGSNKALDSVKNYMMEYSGLTPNQVVKIMNGKSDSTASESSMSCSKPTVCSDSKLNSATRTEISNVIIAQQECAGSTNLLETVLINTNKNDEEHSKTTLYDNEAPTTSNKSNDSVMSDSDASIDFVEVPEKQETEHISLSSSVLETPISQNKTGKKIADSETATQNHGIVIVSKEPDDNFISDSDSSDVLVTVTEKQKDLLEIIIKPDDKVDDDLFSDLFSKNGETNISKQNSVNTPRVDLKKLKTANSINDNSEKLSAKQPTEHEPVADILTKNIVPQTPVEEETSMLLNLTESEIPTREQLREIRQDLEDKNLELLTDQLTKERMANSLNEQIIQETQDLLRLFGVPYVIAPMEAEAQCAFLEMIDLTNGTITDDSDIWLFGGKTVYKHFFNQQKHVMEFRAETILEHYKLAREQMVLLALLVGSDYTLGVQGIGPVTALEILGAFPNPKKIAELSYNYQELTFGLNEFRKWLSGEKTMSLGRTALRSKLKNVTIGEGFPNINVIKAYLDPAIDSSRQPFSWAKPDKNGLIEYARKKFGWSQGKSENILKPILKKFNETQSQKSIKDYFKTKHKIDSGNVENKMSKRVKKAVDTIENGLGIESISKKKGKANKQITQKVKCKDSKKHTSFNENWELSSDEDIQILKKTQTQTKTKLKQIADDMKKQVQEIKKPRVPTKAELHKKEVIPQKQRDKADAFRSKMKAIEVFRKSKKGPGYVQTRKCKIKPPKDDAGLSESSSD